MVFTAELTTFVIACSGVIIGIISALSKCMVKSRCTNIKSPCVSCDREPISADSEVYLDAKNEQ